MSYGIEAFRARDPLAWPAFASDEDVRGLPPTVILVNECDPLRDEGIRFYRHLGRNGVAARCRQSMGTTQGAENMVLACPDISNDAARDIAAFCAEQSGCKEEGGARMGRRLTFQPCLSERRGRRLQ
jgi:acetyl esterase/lipase